MHFQKSGLASVSRGGFEFPFVQKYLSNIAWAREQAAMVQGSYQTCLLSAGGLPVEERVARKARQECKPTTLGETKERPWMLTDES